MTRDELTNLLDSVADGIDFGARRFPKRAVDFILEVLATADLPKEDREQLTNILSGAEGFFLSQQAGEIANFLRDVPERRVLTHFILKRINKANRARTVRYKLAYGVRLTWGERLGLWWGQITSWFRGGGF